MRTVVVGASTGLGRCIGIALAQRGAHVALLARRYELLVDAAKEAGNGALPIVCDVTDPDACRAAVEEAAEAMGGIDSVVYSSGVGELRRIEDVEPEAWRRVFETNVIGASSFTTAVLPHLAASGGVAAYLSSVSASMTPPWPGLGAYIVSKAALDKLVEVWRAEHPHVGFTRVTVGDCGGGEGMAQSQFVAGFDMDLLGEVFPTWAARGLLAGSLVEVEHLINAIEGVLQCGASACVPSIAIVPRRPVEEAKE